MKMYDSIIEELNHSKGYTAVLMTTFNIEFSFLEKYLLHLFMNNEIRHVNLFVDSKQLRVALNENIPVHFGKKYYVSPIEIQGAFHPKVILLLGEKKAKLIVSSANIKMSGYMFNSEIFETFVYDDRNREYEGMIWQAVQMFRHLNRITPVPDPSTQALLNKFDISQQSVYGDSRLLSNLDESIMDQLLRAVHEDILKIRVAVPFYDQNLESVRIIKEKFQCQNIELYVQNELNTFPVEYNRECGIIPVNQIVPFETIRIGEKRKSSFYHGKVFEFVGTENTYILYGSANCSGSALLRTFKESGNIECDVLELKGQNEPSFFTSFEKAEGHELISSLFAGSEEVHEFYWFTYSVFHQENLEVYLKYLKWHEDLSITLYGHKVSYLKENNMVKVQIPVLLLDDQNPIFDLKISFEDQFQDVRCWYINLKKLEYFRKNISMLGFVTMQNEDNPEKYDEYWNAVLDALFNDEYREYVDEIREENSLKSSMQAYEDDNQEEVIEEDNTDFLLGKDISDKFVERNPVFSAAYDATKKYASVYFASLLKTDEYKKTVNNSAGKQDESVEEKKPRKATTAERRISRFIRRNLKKHFLLTDPSMLSYDYYVHLCGIVLYVIDKMKYKEKILDFMPPEEVIKIKSTFAELLIDKFSSDEQTEDDKKLLVRNTLATIVELGTFNEIEKDELAEKLLHKLNRKINIRQTYRYHLSLLDLSRILDENNPFGAERYVGKLFGYKTFEELQDYFEDLYHTKCLLRREGTVFSIRINAKGSEALGESIIQEVLRYVREYEALVKSISFYYRNKEGTDICYVVKFAGLHTNSVRKQFIRSNGTTEYKCRKTGGEWKPDYYNR